MMGLTSHDQAWFIGIRNTFYRFAILTGQGLLVIIAGNMENLYNDVSLAWSIVFGISAIIFMIFAIYHKWILPHPSEDNNHEKLELNDVIKNFFKIFISFFKKPQIILAVSFILIYRFGEAQLVKIAPLFMLDTIELGGLGL